MPNFSFYEQIGIVTPGAVFLFGTTFYVSGLKEVLTKDGISIGSFGIFVVLAYATGHLIAAFGNLIEKMYWHTKGGMPSSWIVGTTPRLLSSPQIAMVQERVTSRLGLSLPSLSDLTANGWLPIFRQIYADVQLHGKPDRGDVFNGNYGLNRGLCAATLMLAVMVSILAPTQWIVCLSLVAAGLVYLYRMQRFGVHYAREVYVQFIMLPIVNKQLKEGDKASDAPQR